MGTTADTAFAKSQWVAATGPTGGSTGVTFSRQFALSDAPQGWSVSLDGLLNGSIFAGSNPASVTASASITPSLGMRFQESLSGQTGPPFGKDINEAPSQTAILANGLYTVSGSLITGAGTGPGVGSSDFGGLGTSGNPAFGFQVNVAAGAIPEPTSFLLLATGFAGVAWLHRKRRRLTTS